GKGKSALGLYLMREHEGGVLWWDPNDDLRVPSWAIEAGPGDRPSALRGALAAGGKVIFHAGAGDEKRRRAQVSVLVDVVQDARASIRLDECHIVVPQGRPEAKVLDHAIRSRHLEGDVGCYSTNPQIIDKQFMHIGAALYVFDCGLVEPWLRQYGHDGDQIMAAGRAAGEHAFVRVVGKTVEGPFALSREQLDPTR
ncbi:MAG: hypothetical protein ACYCW6_25600, partial [Candidatus Xenobia bacterium]